MRELRAQGRAAAGRWTLKSCWTRAWRPLSLKTGEKSTATSLPRGVSPALTGRGGAWLPRPRSWGPKWGVSSPGTPPAGTGQLQRVGLAKPAVGGPVRRLEVEEAGATWDLEPRGSRGGDPDRRPPQGGGAESQPPSPWKPRGDMFTGLKEKSCHPRILYPAKVSFKS